MLIVLAQADLSDGALDAARDAVATMVAASNAEEGCISYTFTQDVLDANKLHIVEQWVDDAALKAHFATPHMAAFQQAIAPLGISVTQALKYEASDGAPLM